MLDAIYETNSYAKTKSIVLNFCIVWFLRDKVHQRSSVYRGVGKCSIVHACTMSFLTCLNIISIGITYLQIMT